MFDYTAEQITAILNRYDKSLINRTEDDRLKVLNNPNLAGFRSDLDICINHFLSKPLYALPFSLFRKFEDDGDRTEFEYSERGYFPRRGHLETELIGAWLYPEREDILNALQDTIWAICDEYTWTLPACMHGEEALRANLQEDCYTIDIFAAETGDTLAEALIMLGDRLDTIVVKRVKRELKKRIIDRFETGTFGWCENNKSNWAAVCGGSVGMTCICELDGNVRLGKILEHLMTPMRNFVDSFAADGTCLEGFGYWSYGFGYFASFADMLYRRTGGEINLFSEPRIRDIALFPQKCCFYGSRGVSFSDSGSWMMIGTGITNMLSKHYEEAFYPENVRLVCGIGTGGCHRFTTTLNNALWAPEGEIIRKKANGCYLLPVAQWYIASGKDNVGIAARGGHNAEPHNHNDIGNLLVYKNGIEILADLGMGEYDKKYFSNERYELTHCGSQGHCVPIIGGRCQQGGIQYCAKDFVMDETGVKMDIAPAYGLNKDNSVIREIRFDKESGKITVADNFILSEESPEIIERFIAMYEPKQTEYGVVIGNETATMTLSVVKGNAEIKIYSGEEKDHGGKPFTMWYIDYITAASSGKCSIAFELK